jgi:hypothetical protein
MAREHPLKILWCRALLQVIRKNRKWIERCGRSNDLN